MMRGHKTSNNQSDHIETIADMGYLSVVTLKQDPLLSMHTTEPNPSIRPLGMARGQV